MTDTPYTDTCEKCWARRTRTAAAPVMAVPDGDGGLIAAYRCPACGHTWTCGWGLQAGPQPPLPPDGADIQRPGHLPPAA